MHHNVHILGADTVAFQLVDEIAGAVAPTHMGTGPHARIDHDGLPLRPQGEQQVREGDFPVLVQLRLTVRAPRLLGHIRKEKVNRSSGEYISNTESTSTLPIVVVSCISLSLVTNIIRLSGESGDPEV